MLGRKLHIYRKKGKTRCLNVQTYIITTKILLEIVMVCLVNLFLMKIVMPLLIERLSQITIFTLKYCLLVL